MALCGAATIVLVALVLAELGASLTRIRVAVALLALSPIALGPISLNTYDAWPALLTVLALWLLLRGWELPAFAVLGLAVSAKVYPLVLVPLAAWLVWRRAGTRRTALALGVLVLVAAAVVAPFAAYAPHGVYESFHSQAARGLQVESLGASLLLVLDRLGALPRARRRDDRRRRPQPDRRDRRRGRRGAAGARGARGRDGVGPVRAARRPARAAAARLRRRGRGLPRLHEGLLAAVPRLAAAARRRRRRRGRGRADGGRARARPGLVLPLRRALPARVAGLAAASPATW